MENFVKSDLASEMMTGESLGTEGAFLRKRRAGEFEITELIIKTEEAAKEVQRPRGRYLTVDCGRIDRLSRGQRTCLARVLAGELRGMASKMTKKRIDPSFCVFAAGLGNAELTPDAIGPETVRRLQVTRHLREYEKELYHALECSSLATLSPGVLGQTGIETREVLYGVAETLHPDLILVIDALTARSCERLAATVQLSDSGITPGSGVGNHRSAITKESMGVPVLAIGVPTVVHSATLVYDALQRAGHREIDQKLHEVLNSGKSFFVSPKECDVICDCTADLLALSIGMAFTDQLIEEE